MSTSAVILAAGEGKRMMTGRAKVLSEVIFRPMISWVTDNCRKAGIENICVVVGKDADLVSSVLDSDVHTALQKERKGTGHAVMCASDFIKSTASDDIFVTLGDAPFLNETEINAAYALHKRCGNSITVISSIIDDPTGYGRIIRNGSLVTAIVEEKDASPDQRLIGEVNTGSFWFDRKALIDALGSIKDCNAQGEYYITDTLEIIRERGLKAGAYTLSDCRLGMGANTMKELSWLNEIARQNILDTLNSKGVNIPVRDGIIISPECEIAAGTTILPGTILNGHCVIGEGCVIGPNSVLEDAQVGNGCNIRSSYITSSKLGNGINVGPFANIRPDCEISDGCRIGDFVEVKNSVLGEKTKASHLTYIGDTDCGSGVNFGCGVVTVNYNGKEKFRTKIGNGCFIGCNTNLVAPVEIGDGAYTAAGSTVTKDVPADALCIARAKDEVILHGRAANYRKKTE